MAKFTILSLAFALLFASSLADPIFLLSSRKINDFSEEAFLDSDAFTAKLNDKVLQSDNLPTNIFVFNVKVNNKKHLQTPSLLFKELAFYPSIQKHFRAFENTFSSVYIKDAFTKTFNEKLLSTFQQKGFKLTKLPLGEFSYEHLKSLKQANNQSLLTVTDVTMGELFSFDNIFHKSFNSFGLVSRNNYLIVLKFTDATDEVDVTEKVAKAIKTIGLVGRILDEATGTDTTTTTTTSSSSNAATEIGITSAGFSGFVTAIILTMALYTFVQVLNAIKAPNKFSKEALHIGKEQL